MMTHTAETLRSAASIRAERRAALVGRYGGIYWGSDFIGFVVAIFFSAAFLAIVGAVIRVVGYELGAIVPKSGTSLTGTQQALGIGGLVGGLIAIFLAYVIGGYTAGRMARFDGARNGIGVVLWTVIVAIVLGVVGGALGGRAFNLTGPTFTNVSSSTLIAGMVLSGAVALLMMLAGALFGGALGARYHRRIDRELGAA